MKCWLLEATPHVSLVVFEARWDLSQVLELGQLGRPASHQGGDPALFFHSQAGSKYGNASAMWQSLSAASYDSKACHHLSAFSKFADLHSVPLSSD